MDANDEDEVIVSRPVPLQYCRGGKLAWEFAELDEEEGLRGC